MKQLNTKEFKEKIYDIEKKDWKNDKPTVIEFFADWCMPCKPVQLVLEQLEKEYAEINFYKVNAEDEYDLSVAFNIRNIPNVIFVPHKGNPYVTTGTKSKKDMETVIQDVFNIKKKN
jgi:thiol-disulfide isomerase/thioredoxin